MAKEKEDRLKKVLEDMSYSLNHIEDIMADDRELLVKLVKQNNTIVQYLKQLDVEMVDEYGEPITKEEEQRITEEMAAMDKASAEEEARLEKINKIKKWKDPR